MNMNQIPPQSSFPQDEQIQVSQPFPSYRRCSRPFIIFMPLPTGLLLGEPRLFELGSPELHTVFYMWPHQSRVKGEDHLPQPADHAHPQIPLVFFATGTHCWLMTNLLSTRTSRSFSAGYVRSLLTLFVWWNFTCFKTSGTIPWNNFNIFVTNKLSPISVVGFLLHPWISSRCTYCLITCKVRIRKNRLTQLGDFSDMADLLCSNLN